MSFLRLAQGFAAGVVDAPDDVGIALELTDYRPGVNVIDAGHTHPFGNDAKRNAVVLLAGIG